MRSPAFLVRPAKQLVLVASVGVVVALLPAVEPAARLSAQSSPLLQASSLVYEGAFRLPPLGNLESYYVGGTAMSYRPSTNTLVLVGHDSYQYVGEVLVPTPGTAGSISGLPMATSVVAPRDVLAGRIGQVNPGSTNAMKIGGTLSLPDGSLIVSAYDYYDAARTAAYSHFRVGPAGNVDGPFRVGDVGFTSGWMLPVPGEWQGPLNTPMLSGNCCIPIVSRTSQGPSVSTFDPNNLAGQAGAQMLLGYPIQHPTLGSWENPTSSYSGASTITGAVFPNGSSSILFFGRFGTRFCYGWGTGDPSLDGTVDANGTRYCYDPPYQYHGAHGYPYVSRVWAYNAQDLVAVRNGTRQPWEVMPYAMWNFDLPFQQDGRDITSAAYDPVNGRIFVGSAFPDGGQPLIHVYRVGGGGSTGDTVPPSVQLTSPAAGTTVSGTVTLSANATDNVGVAGVWFTLDGATIGAEDQSSPYQVAWNSAGVSNGQHVLRAVARDASGNTAYSSTATVTVSNVSADTTPPTVALTSPTAGATLTGTVTLSANATDNVAVASVQFSVDGVSIGTDTSLPYSMAWATGGAGNGGHTLRATAVDTAGNVAMSLIVGVTVNNTPTGDTAPPTVSIAGPSSGSTISGTVTLSATAVDNVGVAGVLFTVDGVTVGAEDTSEPYAMSWNSAGVANGARVIRAVARDAAGNSATSAAVTVTVANTPDDGTPPTVNVTGPATGSTVSGSVTLTASATDASGIAGVQFTVDGAAVGAEDTSAPYSTSWNTTSVSNGSHVIRAVARDTAGNSTSSGSVTVSVNNVSSDTTAPTVSLTAPSSGSTARDTITLSATASDNVGVVSVQFTIDGGNVDPADTTAPYSVSWNSRSVANGFHTVRAVARDAAGNSRTSSGRTIWVSNSSTTPDTSAPTVTISAPSNGATVAGLVAITAAASDNVGVVGVQFVVDGIAVGAEDTSAPFEASWDSGGVPNGAHVISATARDAAGNRQTSPATNVTVRNLGAGTPGDINGDGFPDLVFSHQTGRLYAWFMQGHQLIGQGSPTPDIVDPVWQIVSLDDFNGDRKPDFLWQNVVTGELYVWFRDGLNHVGDAHVAGPSDWKVAATADWNGDGKPDILWHHPVTGGLVVWLMDGAAFSAVVAPSLTQVDPSWRVAGAADVDGDRKADLVWQNSATGDVIFTTLDGLTVTRAEPFEGAPSRVHVLWQIRAVADFDGNGSPDLVFQHGTAGHLYVWFMEGTRLVGDRFLEPNQVNPAWHIVGSR